MIAVFGGLSDLCDALKIKLKTILRQRIINACRPSYLTMVTGYPGTISLVAMDPVAPRIFGRETSDIGHAERRIRVLSASVYGDQANARSHRVFMAGP